MQYLPGTTTWVPTVETHYLRSDDSGDTFYVASGQNGVQLIPSQWDPDPRTPSTSDEGVTNSETFNLAKIGGGKWAGIRNKYFHKAGSGKAYTSDRLELIMADSVTGLNSVVTNQSTAKRLILTGKLGAAEMGIGTIGGTCTSSCNGVANFEDNMGTGGQMGTATADEYHIIDLTALGGSATQDCTIWQEPALFYHSDNRLYIVSHCFALDSGMDLSKSDTYVFRTQQNPHLKQPNKWTLEFRGRLFGQLEAQAIRNAGRITSPDGDLTFTATDLALAADGSTILAITAPNWYDSDAGEASNGHYGCHVFYITNITTNPPTLAKSGNLPDWHGAIYTPSLMPTGRGWDGDTTPVHNGQNLTAWLDSNEQAHWLGNSTCSYDYHADAGQGAMVNGIIEAYKYHITSPYAQRVFMHNTKWRP